MTPQTEIKFAGVFSTHPFAEILAEIGQEQLSGSLRAENGERKVAVYFKDGKLVYAASNARSSRLFDILIRKGKVTREEVALTPNFANDFEFAGAMISKGTISEEERDAYLSEAMASDVKDMMNWTTGNWSFSPLARARDGLSFNVGAEKLMLDFGRVMSPDAALGRFRGLTETFAKNETSQTSWPLSPNEAAALSAISAEFRTTDEILTKLPFPQHTSLHLLYILWLSGLVIRGNWNSAFPEEQVTGLKNSRFARKSKAKIVETAIKVDESSNNVEAKDDPAQTAPDVPSLNDYLKRSESSDNYYDVIGVDPKADIAVIKQAYFSLAKSYHPDHYQRQGGIVLQRVQDAFAKLTTAFEALRRPDTREHYDFKIRKELAERKQMKAAGFDEKSGTEIRQAEAEFTKGCMLLDEGQFGQAVTHFARAANFDPNIAKYRAYYGKALSADPKHRHKAESEIQTAIRIEPHTPEHRIFLIEFFMENNLMKRAEGELNRMLSMFPGNREAIKLLAVIKNQ